MSTTARELLAAIEALPPDEQLDLLAELLRRVPVGGDVPETALDEAAEELFLGYDAEEAADGAGPHLLTGARCGSPTWAWLPRCGRVWF